MKATYTTSLAYYSRNAAGTLVKTVWDIRLGYNAKALHNQAQKDLCAIMYAMEGVTCVEVYTCLESGQVKGYGQPIERNSLRYRENDRWTHTDF